MLFNCSALFHRPVSTDIMFDALTTYLSLNTEIHLLPMMTLRHFITLYCVSIKLYDLSYK